MKHYRSIATLFLALLVFLSGSSFMVGIHYCGGVVQNIAAFTPAEKCAMEKQMPPCHKKAGKSCCDDETISHAASDFSGSVTQIDLTVSFVFEIAPMQVLLSDIIPSASVANYIVEYDPPLRSDDITIAIQVLLI